jgi:hypothetical protein
MISTVGTGRSLKLKAIVFMSLMVLGVGAVLSWYFLTKSEAVLRGELRQRAQAQTRNLAHNSRYGLLTEDTVILERLIDGILQDENVIYVAIVGSDGEVLVDLVGKTEASIKNARARAEALANVTDPVIHYYSVKEQDVLPQAGIYHVAAPVLPANQATSAVENELAEALALLGGESSEPVAQNRLGGVQIIYSLESMERTIAGEFVAGVGITLGTVLIGILISLPFCALYPDPGPSHGQRGDSYRRR